MLLYIVNSKFVVFITQLKYGYLFNVEFRFDPKKNTIDTIGYI